MTERTDRATRSTVRQPPEAPISAYGAGYGVSPRRVAPHTDCGGGVRAAFMEMPAIVSMYCFDTSIPRSCEAPMSKKRGGVLELAVLGLLQESPLHGYELRKRLNTLLGSLRALSYGSLYPALRDMQSAGWIAEDLPV